MGPECLRFSNFRVLDLPYPFRKGRNAMPRSRAIAIVIPLLLAALFTVASSRAAGDVVVIQPNSGEVSITHGQRTSATLFRRGWISCSQGLDLDFRNAAFTHMELWRGGELIQVVDLADGRWDTFSWAPGPACVHVNIPHGSNWSFDRLQLHIVGDYELHWTRGWSVPLTDGGDYTGDGQPDIYPAQTEDWVVTIHVLPEGRSPG
jgi:hypothetical protein